MILATLRETRENEFRVAISPDTCRSFVNRGIEVFIENNAGLNSSFSDKDYKNNGAKILSKNEIIEKADVLLSVCSLPENDDLVKFKKKIIIIGMFNPYENFKTLKLLEKEYFSLITLDFLPRISRAQSMDVLSSQANLAGYKAVIEASSIFKKALPMMMTAAGTIIPAKCLVLGAGVAGLQAIATAKRLGCIVSAFDVRPEVEEQVNSLGAKFIKVEETNEKNELATVYAKEMTDDYKKKQSDKIHETAKDMDIIISTALIPGKKAPILVENKTIKEMKSGSVIIDMAASAGGNIEGSIIGKKRVIDDVILYAPSNLPSLIAYDASLLYSKNILNFTNTFLDDKGHFMIDKDDELLQESLIIKNGKKTDNFYEA